MKYTLIHLHPPCTIVNRHILTSSTIRRHSIRDKHFLVCLPSLKQREQDDATLVRFSSEKQLSSFHASAAAVNYTINGLH